MRKLSSFMSVSLDGYFARENGDVSWTHRQDPEFRAFVAENAQSGSELPLKLKESRAFGNGSVFLRYAPG